jgi:hypothetical protein
MNIQHIAWSSDELQPNEATPKDKWSSLPATYRVASVHRTLLVYVAGLLECYTHVLEEMMKGQTYEVRFEQQLLFEC